MKNKILILLLLTIISCKNNDETFDDLIIIDGIDHGNNCPDVEFPNWESSNYVLPYSVGSSFNIGLSSCTSSYHGVGQPDQFAIDFNMQVGSTIVASRSGTVLYVEESGNDYSFPNNKIVIGHNDGTFDQYMHLTKNGAFVTLGENIEQGTPIGLSGATGLAGYPHLHFVVTIGLWEYPYESTPITFKNTVANPNGLVSGETYTALTY